MSPRASVYWLGAALCAAALQAGCRTAEDSVASATADAPAPTAGAPAITGVTPTEVKAGAVITVTGSGFGDAVGASALTVGGAPATSIVVWSDTAITAVVPADAVTGAVRVRVQGRDSAEGRVVVLWDAENPENVVVGGNRASPLHAQIMEDGEGGTLVVWNDFRSYAPSPSGPQQINIHAQRLNSRGKVLWHAGSVPISVAAGGQYFPQLISDGSGGAIVVWQDHRSGTHYDIYAQRISRTGALLWGSEVAVCAAAGDQERPKVVSDGSGGAIVAWHDHRSGSRYEVYAQRIDGSGASRWTANGVPVATASNNPQPLFPEPVPDGSGGAIIVWQDYRSGAWFLYAQRLDGAGGARWTADGVRLSATAATYQFDGFARPVPDGAGGAIVAWESSGAWTSPGSDLLAQRIDGQGALQWGASGTVVSAAAGDQTVPRMTTDGAGGAIIAWEDCRVGSAVRDIYAQRVSGSGTATWTADGVPVADAANSQFGPRIVPDAKGGAIVTWYDYRDYDVLDGGVLHGVDTFAQRLNDLGVAQWTANGTPISTAVLHQMYPEIVVDHAGGAIIVWEDSRTGSAVDLRSQGISFGGKQ
jgi:hypothetical protein